MFLATSTALSFHVNSAGYKLLWLDSTLRNLMPPSFIFVDQEYLCLIITYAAIVKLIMAVM